jgi:hypothetical protein
MVCAADQGHEERRHLVIMRDAVKFLILDENITAFNHINAIFYRHVCHCPFALTEIVAA